MFEKSEIYKKALSEYQEKVYWEILKPLHVIIVDNDQVYLFYNQAHVLEIFAILKEKYDDRWDFPISLWYENPKIRTIKFMWTEYKVIQLWYDNCDVPKQFEAKL